MNTYMWRKNFTATFLSDDKIIRGKLAFKTKEIHWLDTQAPVIILISVHSLFHEEIRGDLKMNALISTIKSHIKGKVTVLLSDRAHIQTLSLSYQNSLEKAFDECLNSAHLLRQRYQRYFSGCNVEYWHSYIYEDDYFSSSLTFLKNSYQIDSVFQELLHQDAEATYTRERMEKFPNKAVFIEKAIEDILEQCTSLLVLANKGYRFQFYPGISYASVEYVSRVFIPENKRIFWIDVFLSIEKKVIIEEAVDKV